MDNIDSWGHCLSLTAAWCSCCRSLASVLQLGCLSHSGEDQAVTRGYQQAANMCWRRLHHHAQPPGHRRDWGIHTKPPARLSLFVSCLYCFFGTRVTPCLLLQGPIAGPARSYSSCASRSWKKLPLSVAQRTLIYFHELCLLMPASDTSFCRVSCTFATALRPLSPFNIATVWSNLRESL